MNLESFPWMATSLLGWWYGSRPGPPCACHPSQVWLRASQNMKNTRQPEDQYKNKHFENFYTVSVVLIWTKQGQFFCKWNSILTTTEADILVFFLASYQIQVTVPNQCHTPAGDLCSVGTNEEQQDVCFPLPITSPLPSA